MELHLKNLDPNFNLESKINWKKIEKKQEFPIQNWIPIFNFSRFLGQEKNLTPRSLDPRSPEILPKSNRKSFRILMENPLEM